MSKNNDEFLWHVLGRLDFYIGTTNYKAAILLTFNTFIFSSVILKWKVFLEFIGGGAGVQNIVEVLLSVVVLFSISSVIFTFKAILPFLDSKSEPQEYHSNIFFGHISRYGTEEKYLSSVNSSELESKTKDLAFQVHALSKGLTKKFNELKIATQFLVFGSVGSFVLVFLLKIVLILVSQVVR